MPTREQIESYVSEWNEIYQDFYQKTCPSMNPSLVINWGRKYAKIVVTRPNTPGGSVHAFIEIATGDIFKPATWASPAKHARGNISQPIKTTMTGYAYSPPYLRS
jgi:hypothetical protein